jgi:multiple sugar transport system substrate-binding protein
VRPVTRRRLILAGSTGLAALAGCSGNQGSGTDTAGSGGEQTTAGGGGGDTETTPSMADSMTFLHFESQEERRSKIKEITQGWTEETGVELDQRVVAEADLPTEISSGVAANQLPATGELSKRALYSARDAIAQESPTQVVQSIGEDKFYDSVLKQASTGQGGYYGVPLYTWQQFTFYRPSVREEMGLPEPTTWENFEKFAKATHDPDNNVYGCLIGSDKSQFTLQCFQPFALSNDAHVFDEQGNIVFDDDPMVEALEFYARMARKYNPPGEMGPGDVGSVWGEKQTHLYSGNTIAFFYEAFNFDEGETIDSIGAVPYVERETKATFGEVVSTTTFKVESAKKRASRSFQRYLRSTEGEASSPYYQWLHMQVGLFNPVLKGVLESETYQNHSSIGKWKDEWLSEMIPNAIARMNRFGYRGDEVFPEIGQITGNYLITEAIREIINGADPAQTASKKADEMRDLIS